MKRAAENQDDHGDRRRFKREIHQLDSKAGVSDTRTHGRTARQHSETSTCSSSASTFAVRPASNFTGEFPFFKQPLELGHFSLEVDRSFANDDRHLKQYHPPEKETDLNLDLRKGFETFQKRDDNVKERLDNLMKWVLHNKKQFQRPTEKDIGVRYDASITKHDDLIESLDVDFVAWRGHFTKFLCTPYEHREGWEMAVTLFRGTIYISEVETEQDRERRLGMNHWEQVCMYGGYKFEQYVTKEVGKKAPDTSQPVNNIEAYCSVIRSDLGHYKLLYSGEVDCCQPGSKLKAPENYVELKTSRKCYTHKNENNFYRYKMVKWWAQSFLVGIPEVICGFRDDDGVVLELKHYKTLEMPKQSMGSWDGAVCFNFLQKLLAFIKKVAVIDDPSMVYLFERKSGRDFISYTEHRGAEHRFIPEWYARAFVNKGRISSAETKSTTARL